MVNLDRSFPRELQPTGLVAVLGGIDGPDRLVEAVISECLIFDRDCAVHNHLAKYFRLATFSELAMTTAWGATFGVAGISVAWAWTHIVHIMNRLLKNRVKAFHLDLIMIRCVVATKLQYPR